MAPGFDQPVARNGYLWWYVDALSDDGRHGLTLIALVGNVFSPYYARARGCGAADPLDHCALNVCLYRDQGKRWTLTERGRSAVQRSADTLTLGPSRVRWDGGMLEFQIDEVSVPLPSRVRGTVRVYPATVLPHVFALDAGGRHRWRPIAPSARVELDFRQPALRWAGTGYCDSNAGDEPIEDAFVRWDWSRAALADGATAVLYDVSTRTAGDRGLAIRIDRAGAVEPFDAPPASPLPATLWRVGRGTRSEPRQPAAVLRTLEDTPFYARSIVSARLLGVPVTAMHESLSLDRFRSAWVQALLPFRMPRRAGG
jgi:carotenoid 1,2-hydratase